MSYDYTVLAGTQGAQNHRKKDRLFELAERWRLPVVFFTEGGGGRPGDTDGVGGRRPRLLGVPLLRPPVAASCRSSASTPAAASPATPRSSAAATWSSRPQDSNIGMGGPAMIEGGGLGVFRPEEIGPIDVQVPNGVVDIAVADEAEAVAVAKQYLSYFQGPLADVGVRRPAPAAPRRSPRTACASTTCARVIETLADAGSVLELRRGFGLGMVTALDPHRGPPARRRSPTTRRTSAAPSTATAPTRPRASCSSATPSTCRSCSSATRPGIMVGPEVEKTALVRHCAALFVTGANLTVPFFTIVLRKGYGLGAQAMAGGSFKAPFFTVAWPTGEFGGMGLEGAVKLGFRNELAAIDDPDERDGALRPDGRPHVRARQGDQHGVATSRSTTSSTRPTRGSGSVGRCGPCRAAAARTGKKRPSIDTW